MEEKGAGKNDGGRSSFEADSVQISLESVSGTEENISIDEEIERELEEIDSLGIGQDDTSKNYGDINVDTLLHISESVDSLKIPNLQRLGLANLHPIKHVDKVEHPLGYQMKLREASVGKDTMTGHWEMMGLHITKPFKTFTDTGFPQELLDELSERTGHKIVGNKSASGTAILDELGEHRRYDSLYFSRFCFTNMWSRRNFRAR